MKELVYIIKVYGCSRFGEYRLHGVDENGKVKLGSIESKAPTFQLEEDRIYRYHYEMDCMTSLTHQQSDLNQERKLKKSNKKSFIEGKGERDNCCSQGSKTTS